MLNKLEKFNKLSRESAFNKSVSYSVNIAFKRLFQCDEGILLYNEAENLRVVASGSQALSSLEGLMPVFQRKNTAWSREMQISFVQNVLSGMATNILLYEIGGEQKDSLNNSYVLDGQQRLTALLLYQQGAFPIYGDVFWDDIKSVNKRERIVVSIYQFESEIEVLDFYITMNENITHNADDMKYAYDYRDVLLSKSKEGE